MSNCLVRGVVVKPVFTSLSFYISLGVGVSLVGSVDELKNQLETKFWITMNQNLYIFCFFHRDVGGDIIMEC